MRKSYNSTSDTDIFLCQIALNFIQLLLYILQKHLQRHILRSEEKGPFRGRGEEWEGIST